MVWRVKERYGGKLKVSLELLPVQDFSFRHVLFSLDRQNYFRIVSCSDI